METTQPKQLKAEKGLKDELGQLETALEQAIDSVWKCSVMTEKGFSVNAVASSSDPEYNEKVVNAWEQHTQAYQGKINEFLDNLRQLEAAAAPLDHITVPLTVVEQVDEGKNPDLFTKDLLQMTLDRNNSSRGRIFNTLIYADQLEARLNAWDASEDSPGVLLKGETQSTKKQKTDHGGSTKTEETETKTETNTKTEGSVRMKTEQ